MMFRQCSLVFLGVAALIGCGDNLRPPDFDPPAPSDYEWELPDGVPAPAVPANNPMTPEKVELGRYLFYDTRLSGNGTQSCSSCHEQQHAFADAKALPVGSTGDIVGRNSPGLMNVAYYSTLTWMNPNFLDLSSQALVPLFGEFPTELGADENVVDRLRDVPLYQDLFRAAYPGEEDPFTVGNLTHALASFVRSMVSFRSPFDRYIFEGDEEAISASAKRGYELTLTERLDCHHCHTGTLHFSQNLRHENTAFLERAYFNNGLYNIGGTGQYPPGNSGLAAVTGRDEDVGLVRTSSLRNVALTPPYMHDGSVATLDEVLDIYAAGGRNIESGEFAGDGREHPNKSEFVHGFELSPQERADLLAFFESLSDVEFTKDPRFSDPF